jgi:uncharacterized protein YggT (Ycf19 family)
MTEHIQQIKKVTNEGVSTNTTRVIDNDEVANRAEPARVSETSTAARVVWFIAGVIITLLALRFVLVLLGANPSSGFANFIYTISHPFAAPFFGLFSYNLHYGVSRAEISTLVAMAVYALVAFGIAKLFTIRERNPEY